jgi:hypothetical protein
VTNEPAPTPVDNIDLEAFERLIYLRDGTQESFEACLREVYTTLGKVRRGSSFQADYETALSAYTRMAGAITALLTDHRFALNSEAFAWLCSEHVTLHAIFRASAYRDMDHVLSTVGQRAATGGISFDSPNKVLMLLLCWSLDSGIDVDWTQLHAAAPEATHAAMIGMLGVGVTHSEKGYARRLELQSRLDILGAHPLPDPLMLAAGDAFMHCSYTDAPDKHAIKPVMGRLLRELVLRRQDVQEVGTAIVRKERPRIVVPIEWFGSHHAMFRCYNVSIQQLRTKFEVICVYRESEIDDGGKAAFDDAVQIKGAGVSVQEVIKTVENLDPDILFYPSVGMAAWYVTLANFRMAPIQICCPGHPASTFSPVMDYMVSDGELFGDPWLFSEKMVPLPTGTARYIPRPKVVPKEHGWFTNGHATVAIPAMATKLIPPFFKTLREIAMRASPITMVEYHFFTNMVGMSHYVLERDIKRWFQNCVVHPRDTYQGYIDALTACDFAIDTWPFGGTNSIVDCLLYGVPVVTREGQEIHERSGAAMARRAGLPEWTIAHSEEEMIDVALKCLRVTPVPVKMPTQEAVEAEFYGDGPAEVHNGFVNAFWDIYERACNG